MLNVATIFVQVKKGSPMVGKVEGGFITKKITEDGFMVTDKNDYRIFIPARLVKPFIDHKSRTKKR